MFGASTSMGKVKVTRKDLKKDELREFGADLAEWYQRNRKTILVIAGIVAVALLSNWIIGGYNTRRAENSDRLLVKAMDEFNTGMLMTSGAERNRNLGAAVNICETVQKKYPGSKAARQALLLKGNALLYLEQYESAIEQFKQYRTSTNDPQEQATACIALGYCYENRYFSVGASVDEYAIRARDYFVAAQDFAGDSYLRRQAMLGEARIYEQRGFKDSAVSLYDQILAQDRNKDDVKIGRYGDHTIDEMSFRSFLPSVGDLFDSFKVAAVQKERLEALIEAKESAQRLVPQDSETDETGETTETDAEESVAPEEVTAPDEVTIADEVAGGEPVETPVVDVEIAE